MSGLVPVWPLLFISVRLGLSCLKECEELRALSERTIIPQPFAVRAEAEPPGEVRRLPACIVWCLHTLSSLRETALLGAFVPESHGGTPSKPMLLMNYTARLRTSQVSFWNWANQANCKQSYIRQLALLRARQNKPELVSHILWGQA